MRDLFVKSSLTAIIACCAVIIIVMLLIPKEDLRESTNHKTAILASSGTGAGIAILALIYTTVSNSSWAADPMRNWRRYP